MIRGGGRRRTREGSASITRTVGWAMKEFHCGEVVRGCPVVIRAEDEDGLFQKVSTHARDMHGMDEVPPEVVDVIRDKIVDIEV
jgi:predicted small metal-binding protein